MMVEEKEKNSSERLLAYLSPRTAWALAVGTSIGWGSFVVTGNTYLLRAGPAGSILGLLIGALVMLIICHSYHYMMNSDSDAGGVYTYTKKTLGPDCGFLSAWFLWLTYLAMFWANVTSLPLFARYFIGDVFRFGRLYSLFGNEVYLGEALLTGFVILLTGLLCSRSKKGSARFALVLVIIFTVTIAVCFASAFCLHKSSSFSFAPAFLPNKSALSSIIFIAVISPWAFIGFESISHSIEGFSFSSRKSFAILCSAVITAAVLYIFVILLSISAYPPEYKTWLDYIKNLDKIQGIKALPPFYAAEHYLGRTGIFLLMLALFALIVTSLIGNMVALSRLVYAVSKDNVISLKFSKLNKAHIPSNAVWAITVISLLAPFIGRTAIGWIVDVTTIGATIIYGFLSYSTWKSARLEKNNKDSLIGLLGLVLMIIFGVFLVVPTPVSENTITTEAHFLFIVWAFIGFIVFHLIIKYDKSGRFGKSVIVWIALISFVLVLSLIWMAESNKKAIADAQNKIFLYIHGKVGLENSAEGEDAYMDLAMRGIYHSNIRSTFVVVALFVLSITMLISNFMIIRKRESVHEKELGKARTIANTDPMTGVKSKHAFTEFEKNLNLQISEGRTAPFAVVVCDVNGLKHVNDTQGHKAGDEYIRSACRMICLLFKHSPVFRIGGDEFVVVLRNSDYENRLQIMADLNRQSEYNQNHGGVIVAAGLSEFDVSHDSSMAFAFERADALMYTRKKELKGSRE